MIPRPASCLRDLSVSTDGIFSLYFCVPDFYFLCSPSPLVESHRLRWGHMTWSRPCGRPIGHPHSSLSNPINRSAALNPFCVCVWSAVRCCLLSPSGPCCHSQLLVLKENFFRGNSVGQVASATIYALILNPCWTLASQMKLCCEASRLGDSEMWRAGGTISAA